MKILAIGDVVGIKSVDYLCDRLFRIKSELGIDFTVVNGENATEIHGISKREAKALFDAGADVITLGNHAFGQRDICELLSDDYNIIRPANYPALVPGIGHIVVHHKGKRILCMNVLGNALMDAMACPFATVDEILESEKGNYDISILDIHAEATSEKLALARYFDGRISVIFGTHTHVQTADEQILPRGTGYITDLGMTGPQNSIIGTDVTAVIEKFRTKMPTRFTVGDGEIRAHCVLFEVDDTANKVKSVRRVRF